MLEARSMAAVINIAVFSSVNLEHKISSKFVFVIIIK